MSDGDGRLPGRRWWLEAAGWVVLVTLLWGTDLLARLGEQQQAGGGKTPFRLISEQVTSGLAVLIMIPFVLRWLTMFPLRRSAWAAAIIGHTVGTILFAFGHHSLMVAMRIPWYALNGLNYIWREPFVANLIVEYQKDIKIYLGIVIIATAYGLFRRSRETPATAPARTDLPLSEPATPPTGRLVVQTGRGTTVLHYEEIEHLEAARNYVSVQAGGREYVVRETMGRLLERLADGPFTRTHRSHVVNLDHVAEIRTVDGRPRIFLQSGADIPLSRSYRDAFRSYLTS